MLYSLGDDFDDDGGGGAASNWARGEVLNGDHVFWPVHIK